MPEGNISSEIQPPTALVKTQETPKLLESVLPTRLPHVGDRPLVKGLEHGLNVALGAEQIPYPGGGGRRKLMDIPPGDDDDDIFSSDGGSSGPPRPPAPPIETPEPPGEPEGEGWTLERIKRAARGLSRRVGTREPVAPRPRIERTRSEAIREHLPSYQPLNEERVAIEGRADPAGNLSPEDESRRNEVYQQMGELAIEARRLANNFTVVGDPRDPNFDLMNHQRANLREQSLSSRYQGALGYYVDAEIRAAQEAEVPRTPSQFEDVLNRLEQLRRQNVPENDPQWGLERAERDRLIDLAEREGLLDPIKQQIVRLYYGARYKITRAEKEGVSSDPYGRRGKLSQLQEIQAQSVESPEYWAERQQLEAQLRGVVNYAHREGMNVVIDVVKDRRRYRTSNTGEEYPDNGLFRQAQGRNGIWQGVVVRDETGRALINEEGEEIVAQDFDEIREAVDEERRKEPYISAWGDADTPIKFVADDPEELEEMIPYMLVKVLENRFIKGEGNSSISQLDGEKQKLVNALAAFEGLTSQQRRRIKSRMVAELNSGSSAKASEMVHEQWELYEHFTTSLARSSHNSKDQDHFVDSLILDRRGLTLLILEELSKEDGAYWRSGGVKKAMITSVEDPEEGESAYEDIQHDMLHDTEHFAMHNKLKPMQVLLNGHPAFQRVKEQLDEIDEKEERDRAGGILRNLRRRRVIVRDAQGSPMTRWQEYCAKALEWEKTGKFGDPRNKKGGRVVFEHPLARAFRPKDFKFVRQDGTIEISPVDEFREMFEEDHQIQTDKWYKNEKERDVRASLERARNLARVFMVDSVAALSHHFARNQTELDELNKYLIAGGQQPISIDQTVPYKTLRRAMMQEAIKEDQKRPMHERHFVLHSMMTQRWGIDLDLPLFGAWFLGTHDSRRPQLLSSISKLEPQLLEAIRNSGMDEKNWFAARAEWERRIGILYETVLKKKFGKSGQYGNWPGHDDHDMGIKDIRNYLNPWFGISGKTVRLTDLIPILGILGAQDFPRDWGVSRSPIRQMVGLWKGSDEVAFAQTKYNGYIEGPRDMEGWIHGRWKTVVGQMKNLTSKAKDGAKIMRDGPFSGMYLWRDLNRDLGKFWDTAQRSVQYATQSPEATLKEMKESGAKAYTDLSARTTTPIATLMQSTIESTFGQNPGSEKFLNTLYWLRLLNEWVEKSSEYRETAEQPAYAADGALPLARIYMRQFLLDAGLIYTDQNWDKIMLGYVRQKGDSKGERDVIRYIVEKDGNSKNKVKDAENKTEITVEKMNDGRTVLKTGIGRSDIEVEVVEGLLDAFPSGLREEIIRDKLLPMGLDSAYPEDMPWLRAEIAGNQDKALFYGEAVRNFRPRKKVGR